MTREEFEALLEEAFEEGYNSVLKEIEEEVYDESKFDLEEEMDAYSEANDDTKFDKFRKALVKGLDAPAKELGVSNKTRKEIGKTALAITGKMNPKLKAKAFANHLIKAGKGAIKDTGKVTKNAISMAHDARSRAKEVEPELEKLENNKTQYTKGEIISRLMKKAADKSQDKFRRAIGDTPSKQRGKDFEFKNKEEANKAFKKLNEWHEKHKTGKHYSY